MKWINHPLSPAESLKELTIKLLLPNKYPLSTSSSNYPGLGLQIPSFIYHSSLVSINKSFCSSGPGGKMACSQTQRGHLPHQSDCRGAAEKALLSVPASGSETLRPLSLESNVLVETKL